MSGVRSGDSCCRPASKIKLYAQRIEGDLYLDLYLRGRDATNCYPAIVFFGMAAIKKGTGATTILNRTLRANGVRFPRLIAFSSAPSIAQHLTEYCLCLSDRQAWTTVTKNITRSMIYCKIRDDSRLGTNLALFRKRGTRVAGVPWRRRRKR